MFQHLLVPLDGSTLAEAALPPALALAERFGSRITLLQIVSPPPLAAAPDGSNPHGTAQLLVELNELAHLQATDYLRQCVAPLQAAGYGVFTRVVGSTTVVNSILQVAQESAVDTIVMSTHGRGGLNRWVFGSVADKVLRQANIPVLLIRVDEKRPAVNWQVGQAATPGVGPPPPGGLIRAYARGELRRG